MRMTVVAFACGVLALQSLATLPSHNALWLATILCLIGALSCGFIGKRKLRLGVLMLAAFVAGSSWAGWRAEWRLANPIPMSAELRDVTVTGVVQGLPERLDRGVQRFTFAVDSSDDEVPAKIRLSWYPSRGFATPEVRPGERWQLVVRLRRPHGMANPGGFDYERWLLERGIRATGYVRADVANARLEALVPGLMHRVHRARAAVRERFATVLGDGAHAGILIALAIGDQRAISADQWEVFRRTAVGHLVAISGLHVSLVALAFGGLAGWLWRRFPACVERLPAMRLAAGVGLVAAAGYALLAGLGLPAQRALVMLGVGAAALALGRVAAPSRVLAMALAVVLVFDPWAVLSAGFWLSFGAVAVIVLVVAGRLRPPSGLRSAVRIQLAITLALTPVLFALFGAFSVVGPFANAFAIPLVSFVIAPLVLLSVIVPWAWLLQVAHAVTGWMMAALGWLADLPVALWHGPDVPLPLVLCAVVGVLWLLMPRGTPGKLAGVLALLPMLLWQPERPEAGSFRATVLDVGQGLAVHVQTARHDLIFDAGPPYGPVADAGERVLLPALRAGGVSRLDVLVLSHGDADHVGGAASLIEGMEVGEVWYGVDARERSRLERGGHDCIAGVQWRWDEVHFELLHPGPDARSTQRNEGSCVLRVAGAHGVLLLPGDIGVPSERVLVRTMPERLASDVVVAPHHGSRSSSSPALVNATGARHVIHPVGNLNRYRHPHPEVWARWAQAGARNWRTDSQGAILLDFGPEGVVVSAWRERHPRYWHGR